MWAYQKSEGIGKSAWYLYSCEHNVIEKGPAFLEQKDNFCALFNQHSEAGNPGNEATSVIRFLEMCGI